MLKRNSMPLLSNIKNFSQKKFVQDVSILQTGSFFSLGLSAIASIIFARLLGSSDYGLYALIFAFIGLVGLFMDLGTNYTVLTLLPAAYAKKDKKEIKNILSYFLYIVLFISLIVGSLALVFSPFLTDLLYDQIEIGQLARYLILASMIRILFSMLTVTLQSIRKIISLTLFESLNKLIYLVLPVSFVLLGYGLWGIVFGHFLSAILFFMVSFLFLYYLTKKNDCLPSLIEIVKNFRNIKFRQYFNFGFLIALNKNLTNLYSVLPVVFLGMFAITTSQVAYFKIALGYLALPLIFITAIARILMVELPRSLTQGGEIFKNNFKKVTLVSGFIFISLLIIFVILAPYLIGLLYGQEYLISIKLVYFLSLSSILAGFGVGYSSFFRTLNKVKPLFWLNLCMIISGICLFYILINFLSPLKSVVSLVIYFNLGGMVAQSIFVIRCLKKI